MLWVWPHPASRRAIAWRSFPENRPEWSLADLAVLCLRAVVVPIYTTQAVNQIRYILENSGSKMLLVSGKKLYQHAAEAIRSVEEASNASSFSTPLEYPTMNRVRQRSMRSRPRVTDRRASGGLIR